jgi:predicted  nucleic acid-binding Zn-ribbon protein
MSPVIESLLTLQGYDQRINRLEAELDRIPHDEKNIEQKLAQQSTRFEKLKTDTRQLEADRKKIELEVQTKKDAIAKYRTQQQVTRKNEEFTALDHEISHAEKAISEWEDAELELMLKYDAAQKEVAAEQIKVKEWQVQAQQLRADLAKKKATLEADLTTTEEKQEAAEKTIEATLLTRYRRILDNKKNSAVVPIEHETCTGCHTKVTHQTIVSAKAQNAVVTCENCGRIVYWAN